MATLWMQELVTPSGYIVARAKDGRWTLLEPRPPLKLSPAEYYAQPYPVASGAFRERAETKEKSE